MILVFLLKIISNLTRDKSNILAESLIHLGMTINLHYLELSKEKNHSLISEHPSDIIYFTMARSVVSSGATHKLFVIFTGIGSLLVSSILKFNYFPEYVSLDDSSVIVPARSYVPVRPDVDLVVVFRRKWCSPALVWGFFLASTLVLVVKMTLCREKHRKLIQHKVRQLKEWKEFLMDRNNDSIIGTGSFQKQQSNKVASYCNFNVKKQNDLMFIFDNLQLVEINNEFEVKIEDEQPAKLSLPTLMQRRNKRKNLIEILSVNKSIKRHKSSHSTKVFTELDIAKLNNAHKYGKMPDFLRQYKHSQLYFELYYHSYIQDDSSEVYLLSFKEITDKIKFSSLLKKNEVHERICQRLTTAFDKSLEYLTINLVSTPNFSSRLQNVSPEHAGLTLMNYLMDDIKLSIRAISTSEWDIQTDGITSYAINDDVNQIISVLTSTSTLADAVDVKVEYSNNFNGFVTQDRSKLRQLMFNTLYITLQGSSVTRILISFRIFYSNTIEMSVRDISENKSNHHGMTDFKLFGAEKLTVSDKRKPKMISSFNNDLGMFVIEKLCKTLGPFDHYFVVQSKNEVVGLRVYFFANFKERKAFSANFLKSLILRDQDKSNISNARKMHRLSITEQKSSLKQIKLAYLVELFNRECT